jgi:hypothetical protein
VKDLKKSLEKYQVSADGYHGTRDWWNEEHQQFLRDNPKKLEFVTIHYRPWLGPIRPNPEAAFKGFMNSVVATRRKYTSTIPRRVITNAQKMVRRLWQKFSKAKGGDPGSVEKI